MKTVAVVTSTRAEWGLLRPCVEELMRREEVEVRLVATGAHLLERYGYTVREIEESGLPVAARLPIPDGSEGPLATARAIAATVEIFASWFGQERPGAVLLLGDRYEIFAVAAAAAALHVPIAHISGGDVTLGAADDYYRHCISKMAALHFPSNSMSARRLVRMGEDPARVFNVGGLGDENMRKLEKLPLDVLSKSVGDLLEETGQPRCHLEEGPFALVTFHPETAGTAQPGDEAEALLTALAGVNAQRREAGEKLVYWLFTGANADEGGSIINAAIHDFLVREPAAGGFVASLGAKRYLSALGYAAAVVGNSSSGVVETPTFGVPTVNIGLRQAGRPLPGNILSCRAEAGEISAALHTALTPEFRGTARCTVSPYNGGDTARRIAQLLSETMGEPGFGAPKGFYEGGTP